MFPLRPLRDSACTACALSAFLLLIAPFQIFLASQDDFSYHVSDLLLELLPYALGLALVLTLLLWVLHRFALPRALFLAVLFCLYLECGLLSIGLPPLDGISTFSNLGQYAIDTAVWLACLGVACIFRKPIACYANWIAAGLTVLAIASLFDAKQKPFSTDVSLSAGLHPCYDIVMNAHFSKERNILLFIWDMTPGSIITEVMKQNPELQTPLIGFTAFPKNLTLSESTANALPALMTGCYRDNESKDFGMSIYGEHSFLYDYAVHNLPVYFFAAFHPFGYTNRFTHSFAKMADKLPKGRSPLMSVSKNLPHLRLFDALRIRVVPYAFKNRFLSASMQRIHHLHRSFPNIYSETFTYAQLAQQSLTEEPCVLGVYHTNGIHWPITKDRYGQRLPASLGIPENRNYDVNRFREGMREYGYFLITTFIQLIDQMKRQGIYDKATIIVATDHGCVAMQEGQNQGSESGVLWVKPAHATVPFAFDQAPTTNLGLRDLFVQLRERDLSLEEIKPILSRKERIFRSDWHGVTLHHFGGKLRYKDWVYDENNTLIEIRQH